MIDARPVGLMVYLSIMFCSFAQRQDRFESCLMFQLVMKVLNPVQSIQTWLTFFHSKEV